MVAPKPATAPLRLHRSPSWVDQGTLRVSGAVLTLVGLVLPTTVPESATVLKVSARR